MFARCCALVPLFLAACSSPSDASEEEPAALEASVCGEEGPKQILVLEPGTRASVLGAVEGRLVVQAERTPAGTNAAERSLWAVGLCGENPKELSLRGEPTVSQLGLFDCHDEGMDLIDLVGSATPRTVVEDRCGLPLPPLGVLATDGTLYTEAGPRPLLAEALESSLELTPGRVTVGGGRIALATTGGIVVADLQTGEAIGTYDGGPDVVIAPNGEYIAMGSLDTPTTALSVVHLASGLVTVLEDPTELSPRFVQDFGVLVSVAADDGLVGVPELHVVDPMTGALSGLPTGSDAVSILDDGRVLVDRDGDVLLWSPSSGALDLVHEEASVVAATTQGAWLSTSDAPDEVSYQPFDGAEGGALGTIADSARRLADGGVLWVDDTDPRDVALLYRAPGEPTVKVDRLAAGGQLSDVAVGWGQVSPTPDIADPAAATADWGSTGDIVYHLADASRSGLWRAALR